jgi:hypothetical protein
MQVSHNAQHSLSTPDALPGHHPGEVIMRRTPASIVAAACVMALGASGCAHARRPVVLEPAASASKSRLADLPPMPGAHVVVLLRTGTTARGVVETVDESVLVLRPNEPGSIARRVAEDEIVCLARRVGKSTTARGWLGALIGAGASHMMMPAAIVGALIAGNTGQPRARVLLDRSQLASSAQVCRSSLTIIPD